MFFGGGFQRASCVCLCVFFNWLIFRVFWWLMVFLEKRFVECFDF